MTTYVNPYTGQTINPSQVGYEYIALTANTELQWPINGNTSDVVANIIEVSASTAGLKLIMPPATQVSEGQSALIRNVGANAFTVVTNTTLATIVSVASGVAQYVYVTNNTTIAGTWSSVTFGAGTSSANAADLAGYGLVATSTTLNQSYPLTSVFSDYVLTNVDRASFLVWESGAGSMTLPTAATVGNNWFVMIRNNGTGILTVYPAGTDTIDGNAQAQLQLAESFVVVSNGTTGYNSYGYGQSATFVYTQLNKVVTGGTVTLSVVEASSTIQEYTGVLTSNCIVVIPSTVQLYSLQNKTTGAFTLTFKTVAVGATTVVLPQNETIIAICDGTNVYNAQTSTSSTITALKLGSGSAAAPSLAFTSDTTTGLYLAASGQLGFSTGGTNRMTLTSTGLAVPNGIAGGTFT
jgi:hypothetical protein